MSTLKPQLPPYSPVQAMNLSAINVEFRRLYEMIWSFHRESGLVDPVTGTLIDPTPAVLSSLPSVKLVLNVTYDVTGPGAQINEWVIETADTDYFDVVDSVELLIKTAGTYLVGFGLRILQVTPYAAEYVSCMLRQESVLVQGTAEYVPVNGNDLGRTSPVCVTTVVTATANDTLDVWIENGDTADHQLLANGSNFWAVKLT